MFAAVTVYCRNLNSNYKKSEQMKSQLFPRSERGIKDIGWLRSNFYFSFSDYCHPLKSAFGTLVAFNDDYVEAGKGFGIHPHTNMEIISVLLTGKMNHIDTLGYSTTIGPGGVQIMSAGSGLRHEEYNIGEEEVNFLQIWIQPKQQNITPRYQQRSFPLEGRRNKLQTIVWNEEGQGHCWINQNTRLSLGQFDTAQEVVYSFHPVNKCIFIFLIEGKIRVGGTDLQPRDAIGVWETGSVPIHCEAGAHFLVIETPINQK
jgi:quercetin 2,3-dioxygenase